MKDIMSAKAARFVALYYYPPSYIAYIIRKWRTKNTRHLSFESNYDNLGFNPSKIHDKPYIVGNYLYLCYS